MSTQEACASPAIEIVFVDLEASAAVLEAAEKNEPRLSAADKARAAGLAGDAVRLGRWRATRIATRIAIECVAGPRWRKVDFELAASGGRPFLAGAPHFNVSHSGGAALIAVASLPVGVDLEGQRDLAMTAERQRRIVTAAARLGKARSTGDSSASLLEAWVRLEAAAKALGTGIGRLLTDEGVIGGNRAIDGISDAVCLDVRALDVAPGYVAAVAAAALPEKLEVRIFPSDGEGLANYLVAARRFEARR